VIRNVVYEHVSEHYKTLRPRFPSFCGCSLCESDVMVYGLNRIPPKYVSTSGGGMITEVDLELGQAGTDIDIILLEGFRKVGAAPRCGGKPSTIP
jgi:competence protein ComFB